MKFYTLVEQNVFKIIRAFIYIKKQGVFLQIRVPDEFYLQLFTGFFKLICTQNNSHFINSFLIFLLFVLYMQLLIKNPASSRKCNLYFLHYLTSHSSIATSFVILGNLLFSFAFLCTGVLDNGSAYFTTLFELTDIDLNLVSNFLH